MDEVGVRHRAVHRTVSRRSAGRRSFRQASLVGDSTRAECGSETNGAIVGHRPVGSGARRGLQSGVVKSKRLLAGTRSSLWGNNRWQCHRKLFRAVTSSGAGYKGNRRDVLNRVHGVLLIAG